MSTEHRYTTAKYHRGGRQFEAVVMDAAHRNRIVYRSGLSWNAKGRDRCDEWLNGGKAK